MLLQVVLMIALSNAQILMGTLKFCSELNNCQMTSNHRSINLNEQFSIIQEIPPEVRGQEIILNSIVIESEGLRRKITNYQITETSESIIITLNSEFVYKNIQIVVESQIGGRKAIYTLKNENKSDTQPFKFASKMIVHEESQGWLIFTILSLLLIVLA